MFNFLPHTAEDRQAMLADLGMASTDALFADIPATLREGLTYRHLPESGLSEPELQSLLQGLAQDNAGAGMACFLGGGAYQRFIPSAVGTIAGRSEFYTSYTPYQPEVSQGTLQVIFEFQTMIAELTGLDVANASVYDGGTAVSEAALMAYRLTKRPRLLAFRGLHPHTRQILETYAQGLGDITLQILDSPTELGQLSPEVLKTVATVLVQQPDYFGRVADLAPLASFCQAAGAKLIVSADPVALGLLQPPGEAGADIVVGDIQPLGNALAFGGPYGGYMATKHAYLRQLPGRLVGRTTDADGRPCYTLTLQTREQHIRREKATSNICTNQALNVLKATAYLSLVGPQGLRQVAEVSARRAHALAERLCALPGVSLVYPESPFLFEFALRLPRPVEGVLSGLAEAGILGGIPLAKYGLGADNELLVAVTELNTPAQLDRYVDTLAALLQPAASAVGVTG